MCDTLNHLICNRKWMKELYICDITPTTYLTCGFRASTVAMHILRSQDKHNKTKKKCSVKNRNYAIH